MDTEMIKTLLPSFIAELEEYTQTLESDIIEMETTSDKEILNKVFRAFHSIKGSSGIIGFKKISEFTHKAEFLLEEARSGRFEITSDFIDVLLNCNNIYKQFLILLVDSGDVTSEDDVIDDELYKEMKQTEESLVEFSAGKGNTAQTGAVTESKQKLETNDDEKQKKITVRFFEISIQLKPTIFETGNDPIMYLTDLLENGEYVKIECDMHKIKPLSEFTPQKNHLSWNILYKTDKTIDDINNVFLFILDDNKIIIDEVTEIVYKFFDADMETLTQILDENETIFPSQLNISDIVEDDSYKEIKKTTALKDFFTAKKGKGTLEDALKEIQSKPQQESYGTKKEPVRKNETVVADKTKSVTKTTKSKRELKSQFIKVDITKIDELVKLVGEMVIGYSQMMQSVTELISEDWEQTEVYTTVESFHRTIRDIQDKVMKVRMVPIGPTFAQFKLLIRDYSSRLDKKVKLEMFGEDTELDKRIIEVISDPLRHMVRNSVDHGIESPDARSEAGKPETGTIKLNAYHEEGNMIIEIIDDGKGLNKDIILEKAAERGLYDPKKGKILEDSEIFNFIFEPGFSTASEVSDLSGRGVGMDVVKNNIESIRGKIYVESKQGLGTTFKIILPLTVSIIDGMIFKVGDKLFILPLLSINELIRPESKMIKVVEGRSEVINLRGEFLPLLRLYEEFDIEAKINQPTEAIILIVESEGRKYGLMVDELIGQQQVVIKPMDSMFEKVKGITGASILGNGKVALIIDAPSLIKASGLKKIAI